MFQVFAKSTQQWSARYAHDELEIDQNYLGSETIERYEEDPNRPLTEKQRTWINSSDGWFGEFLSECCSEGHGRW